jgi:two-component system NtrC family response regulator
VRVAGDGDTTKALFAKTPADLVLLGLAVPPHHAPDARLALFPASAPAPVVTGQPSRYHPPA